MSNSTNTTQHKTSKSSLTSTLDYLYNRKQSFRNGKNPNLDQKNNTSQQKELDFKNILNGIKIFGKLINDKSYIINQEIYPEGSVLLNYKNKLLNKIRSIDDNLLSELSSKLNTLDKESKKLDENKLVVYNIANYVNNNIKELTNIDNDNIEIMLRKFNELRLKSKADLFSSYEEILSNKNELNEDKCRALISHLIFENKRLDKELESEKSNNEKLQKKITESEKRSNEINAEHYETLEFYEKKIELLENVIFSNDDKNKKNLVYDALEKSINDFNNLNSKLKEGLEKNMMRFQDNKKFWLEDMIKAKEDFRNEMSYYLKKSYEEQNSINEKPVVVVNNNKSKNSKDEEIKKLKEKLDEQNSVLNEQKIIMAFNNNLIDEYKKELKAKDEMILSLENQLNQNENK